MGKFDDQLSRMSYLMEYKTPSNTPKGNIEYHANGADGKVYGILKEGTKYYIKSTESGKENIAESYDYLGGFNNRKQNEYKSYNDATKHLELHLMSLNESRGIHEDVSTVDFNRGEKMLANLTEAARTELNRMKQIFENSTKIGMNNTGDPESKGKATAENTKKNNDPFSETASASLDKDLNASQSSAKSANADYKDASSGVESKLTSDKAPASNGNSLNDYKDAHDDLDGEGVADKKPKGHTVTHVNESFGGDFDDMDVQPSDLGGAPGLPAEENFYGDDDMDIDDMGMDDMDFDGDLGGAPDQLPDQPVPSEVGDDIVGGEEDGEEDMDMDQILENLENECGISPQVNEEQAISGDYDELTGPGTDSKKNSISMEKGPSNPINEENYNEEPKESDAALDGPNGHLDHGHTLPVQCWDKMKVNEAINRATQLVMKRLNESMFEDDLEGFGEDDFGDDGFDGISNDNSDFLMGDNYDYEDDFMPDNYSNDNDPLMESLKGKIKRIVAEETTRLNAWGKHPRYRQQPMQLPPNKEVMKGTADRDWNDDSAKGEQPYGQKIGSSAPFDQKVEMLTDSVMSQLKESLGLKKK